MSFSEPLVCSGHLGPLQHPQQLGLVGVQPLRAAGRAWRSRCGAGRCGRSAPAARPSATPAGLAPVGLQVGVEPPDQGAHALLGGVLPVGEGVELVDQPLGMHPAQGVPPSANWPASSRQITVSGSRPCALMLPHSAPSVAIRDRIGRDRQRGDAEPLEMRQPGRLVREVRARDARPAGDHRPGQGALAHVGQRLGIDHVVARSRPAAPRGSSAGSSSRWWRTRRSGRCRAGCRRRSGACGGRRCRRR